jgi:histidine triad (HIT) family protein
MFNHKPSGYECPLCHLIAHDESEYNRVDDIVYQNDIVTASVAPKWWVSNPGSLLVFPSKHYENLYDIPDEDLTEVYKLVKLLAIAIRSTYGCDGTSTRQHNEPAGNQDVWHLHVHIFPRYKNDQLYKNHDHKQFVSAAERKPYADKLRAFLQSSK